LPRQGQFAPDAPIGFACLRIDAQYDDRPEKKAHLLELLLPVCEAKRAVVEFAQTTVGTYSAAAFSSTSRMLGSPRKWSMTTLLSSSRLLPRSQSSLALAQSGPAAALVVARLAECRLKAVTQS